MLSKTNISCLKNVAIEFIIENAEALGGDPSRVTISGESAGGWSVGNLLINTQLMRQVNQGISHSGVVLFDMMNQHTETVNDFIRKKELSSIEGDILSPCIL